MDDHIEDCHENIETESSRRSFLKKSAIVAAPIILTAWSRPVLGATTSLSGILSGNVSGEGGREGDYGKSPGWWKNNLIKAVDPDTPYHDIFDGTYIPIDPLTQKSFSFQIVLDDYNNNGNNDYSGGPAFQLIAAYCNSLYYENYLLSTNDVLDIAYEYYMSETKTLKSDLIRNFLDTTWT